MKIAIAGCSALAALAAVWQLGGTWALLPFLGLVVVGAALAWIDLTQRRLPNRIVLPAIATSVPLLLATALLDGSSASWLRALAGGSLLFLFYLVLALVSPGGMGMGDVKLAALVGLFAGYVGWAALLVAAFGGFLAGGAAAMVVIATRQGPRGSTIPFGPWMLVGLWAAVAVSG